MLSSRVLDFSCPLKLVLLRLWLYMPVLLCADDLPAVPGCHFEFTSTQRKSGTFQSPHFPHPYPANTACTYIFQGQGRERVQIAFLAMDLYHPAGDTVTDMADCVPNVETDDIRVIVNSRDGQPTDVAMLCGKVRSKMLMSSNTQLTVIFNSRSVQTQATGFKAEYSFLTNFGITSGVQDNNLACSFAFMSDQASNGTFTSPNYPGIYPRNAECHYLFYGAENERVYIKFAYFDIDGEKPHCADSSDSDYVELSNFRFTDRKMGRLCGHNVPAKDREVLSDDRFFRVTFRSNDRFDATGFEAFYQFRNYDDNHRHGGQQFPVLAQNANSSASSSLFVLPISMVTVALSLLLHTLLTLFTVKVMISN